MPHLQLMMTFDLRSIAKFKSNKPLEYTKVRTCVCMLKKQADRNNFVTSILELRGLLIKVKLCQVFWKDDVKFLSNFISQNHSFIFCNVCLTYQHKLRWYIFHTSPFKKVVVSKKTCIRILPLDNQTIKYNASKLGIYFDKEGSIYL